MSKRHLVAAAFAWVLSLVGVVVWAQGTPPSTAKPPRTIEYGSQYGEIITGENIGVQRVVTPNDRPGQVTGRIMVKVDGQWLEVVPVIGKVRTP